MNRRHALVLGAAGLGAVLVGAWVGWQRHGAPSTPDPAVEALFQRSFPDADGVAQPLAQWRGKLLVINFWATWCAPCVEEMPDLDRVRQSYRGRNVEIVGLGIDSADKIRAFRDDFKLTLPLLVAGSGGSELGRLLGNRVDALPYTVLIAREGRVVQRRLGQVRRAELTTWLDARLGAQG